MVIKKTKTVRTTAIIAIITVIVLTMIFLTGSNHSGLSTDDLNNKLESLVSTLAVKDKSIRNCVLAVTKGNDSYSWAGAAGVARQDGHDQRYSCLYCQYLKAVHRHGNHEVV
jgi:hypothetical protein